MNSQTVAIDQIINQLLSAVLVVNRDLTIAWTNPATEELLGLSQRQLKNTHLSEVIIDADYSVKAIAYSLKSIVSIRLGGVYSSIIF